MDYKKKGSRGKARVNYFTGGMMMPGRNLEWDWSRMGYNGKQKDDEIYGKGNTMDYGARIYSAQINKWLSPDSRAAKSPQLSPYNFAANNPIIYVDPDGNTEFYFGGKWIGTDKVDNNLLGIVTDKKVAGDMKAASEAGKLITQFGDLQNGDKMNGSGFAINKDVLQKAYDVLELSLSPKGQTGEFNLSMSANGNNYSQNGEMMYTNSQSTDANGNSYANGASLPAGDVSMHSHPTGASFNKEGNYIASDPNPSPNHTNSAGDIVGDESVFENYSMNIIVGRTGTSASQTIENGMTDRTITPGRAVINVFDKGAKANSSPSLQLGKDEAQSILKGPSGKTYEKFNDKNN